MKAFAPAVLILISACSATPEPQGTSAGAPETVEKQPREGEAPATSGYDKTPERLAAIEEMLAAEGPGWASPEQALADITLFAAHAAEAQVPTIDGLLRSGDPVRRARGIFIVRLSRHPATVPPLESNAALLLKTEDAETAHQALAAMSHRKAVGATPAILDYHEATEDPLALRTLGRLWSPPVPDTAEARATRTLVHLLAHHKALDGEPPPEAVDALLRVMTDDELEAFLAKWSAEDHPAIPLAAGLASERGFPAGRGRRIHEALLQNPRADILIPILHYSPHRLSAAALRPLLTNEERLPREHRVCDAAAARLESTETGLKMEVPEEEGKRERLLKKWRSKPE